MYTLPHSLSMAGRVRLSMQLMPKYEVVRSYTVSQVAKLEAENANQARIIAMNWDGHWKEYEGDYDTDITVYEVSDE